MRVSLKAGLLVVIIFLCIILFIGKGFLDGFYYAELGMSLVVGIGVIAAVAAILDYQKRRKPKGEAPKPIELGLIIILCVIWLVGRLVGGSWFYRVNELLVVCIGVIAAIAAALHYQKGLKSKEVMKLPEPIITAEHTIFRAPAKLREPTRPQKLKQLSRAFNLGAKCSETNTLLDSFNEDPSPTNDRKAWDSFNDLVDIMEQTSSEYGLQEEYAKLIMLRNTLGRLRRRRNQHKIAGRDDLADESEGVIQSNYVDSICIIKEIQEKLSHLRD